MPNALLIHGTPDREEYFDPKTPSPSNAHWLPWLQKQLLIRGCETQTPEMPAAYRPNYEAWSAHFQCYLLTAETLLVGHSCGGGFLLRWLSERQRPVARLVLVAPWMDPNRNHCDPGFFDFQIDSKLTDRTDLHLLYSDNDSDEVARSVELVLGALPKTHGHLLPGCGHFCHSDLGGPEFPMLRDILLGDCPG